MDNMLGYNIIVYEFKHQLYNYIHIWTNTTGKGMNPPTP